MMPKQSDLEHALPDVDALVRAIMERDKAEPSYALLIARALIAALPTADVQTIMKCPKPFDAAAMVG